MTDMTAVNVTRDFYALRIHIGDTLHLHIDNDRLLGVQAWCDEHRFCVEYTLRGGTLLTEYTERDRWRAVLKGLDQVL